MPLSPTNSSHYIPVDFRLWWLRAVCLSVMIILLVGGITRLTGSGLSMVDWRPIMGTIPPLTEADWLEVFKQYQQFPEYQYVNEGMTLSGFKFIFFFEYAHRVLGRAIGLVFFFPMVFFWWRGDLPRALKPHVVFMFVLGGLQGLLGWYMVKSGLVDDPHVSQYRLTAHLSLAVAIFAYMFYVALELQRNRPLEFMRSNAGTRYMPSVLVGLVALMIVIGGFVAPSININTLDEEAAGLPIVRETREMPELDTVMSNSFGFGGTNSTLVFSRYND